MLAERQPIRRADAGISPTGSAPAAQSDMPEEGVIYGSPGRTLPPPLRAISDREHALRAHFRQAHLERGQRSVAVSEQTESPEVKPEVKEDVAPLAAAPAVIHTSARTSAAEPVVRAPAFLSHQPADVLERALHAKRKD